MKFRAVLEIEVPDNADFYAVEDKKLEAEQHIVWNRIVDKVECMARTDLTNKCGSCKYFTLKPDITSCSYGKCNIGHRGYKQRSCRKCKQYERKEYARNNLT